jgi:hypothetical protein
MSLCARCGMNEPLPTDPDDYCRDCALEIEALQFALDDLVKMNTAEDLEAQKRIIQDETKSPR